MRRPPSGALVVYRRRENILGMHRHLPAAAVVRNHGRTGRHNHPLDTAWAHLPFIKDESSKGWAGWHFSARDSVGNVSFEDLYAFTDTADDYTGLLPPG